MGSWGIRGYLLPFASVMVLLTASGSARANPVAPPLSNVFEIAILNLPINGLLLLGLYLIMVRLGKPPIGSSALHHFLSLLSVAVSITLLGAMIDDVAYYGKAILVWTVGAIFIGWTSALLAYRYLATGLRECLTVFVGFFVVNIVSWSVMDEDLVMTIYELYFALVWVSIVLFLVLLLGLSIFLKGWGRSRPAEVPEEVQHTEDMRMGESVAVTFLLLVVFFIFGTIYLPWM